MGKKYNFSMYCIIIFWYFDLFWNFKTCEETRNNAKLRFGIFFSPCLIGDIEHKLWKIVFRKESSLFLCFSPGPIYNSFYSRVLAVPLFCSRIFLVIVNTSIRFTILVDFIIEIISKVEKMFTSWKTLNI